MPPRRPGRAGGGSPWPRSSQRRAAGCGKGEPVASPPPLLPPLPRLSLLPASAPASQRVAGELGAFRPVAASCAAAPGLPAVPPPAAAPGAPAPRPPLLPAGREFGQRRLRSVGRFALSLLRPAAPPGAGCGGAGPPDPLRVPPSCWLLLPSGDPLS